MRIEPIWDSFAAHALQGLLAAGKVHFPDSEGDVEIARNAALVADAMMEERQKRVEKGRLRERRVKRKR